ncbi:histidine phosphatase family protein [Azospirillum sp. SYSU D00513]|uniref:SixA phosphatase family protein n=1 Tax=Azospirillum sp. SYSU D00513 TaxID=2812561 RepID=UPI001A95729E|nr:histidine phosphatase family protein [Azospirillum sp. SYSU D00513]
MKTLYLLRHAKSAWDAPALPDHDRPLAGRGERAAPLVGRYLKEKGVLPDLVLCSTARRAQDTCALVLEAMGADQAPVERERRLYLCGAQVLLDRIREVRDEVSSLMLVAHNPDLHRLAWDLAGSGDPAAREALEEKFPTGACAILLFEGRSWREIAPATGRLLDFVRPRTLES